MPVTFHPADHALAALVADVLRRHRPDLHAAGVTVAAVLAETGNEDEPALKAKGVPVAADVRVVPPVWRALGVADALLRLDAAAWAARADAAREGLLHHELMHLALAKCWEKPGGGLGWESDDRGRPKLRTRPGDLTPPDGFEAVIAAHGVASPELLAWRAAAELGNRANTGELSPAAAGVFPARGLFADAPTPDEE